MIEEVSLMPTSDKIEKAWIFEGNGLVFTSELTFEQWLECGEFIGRIGKGVHWWIGDWINYGHQRWDHTPRYKEAIKQTGFDKQTLMNDAWISSRIETSRRREVLSHSHHAEVARYDKEEQELLLDQATTSGWSRERLRREKSDILASIVQTEPVEEVPDPSLPPIHHCPIARLSKDVEAGSLDAIITDPPYPREFLDVYKDLADFAIHALKDGGSLIAMVGQSYLPDILDMLRKDPLTYHWLACYYVPGTTTKQWQRNIGISWKPLLWFVKGKYTGTWRKDVVRYEDTFDSENVFIGNKKDKKYHEWGQPESDMANIIKCFTQEGQLICDPFVGGGATAVAALACDRRFVGGDIDKTCVNKTRKRLQDALIESLVEREEVSA